ncbi:MAG: twitching motility protein PilT [Bacillota bacterium]|nr:twitching motility protein PilT [Bacillota bacterium]
MLKFIIGGSGTGKTQRLVELANDLKAKSSGNVVFIDDDTRHMYDVDSKVRFINIKEFPIDTFEGCLGFLCGIISSDYDIESILVDGLFKVMNIEADDIASVVPTIEKISELFEIDLYVTVSLEKLPEELASYEYK